MGNEVIVSFPGIGIGEMTINKVAFSIGSLDVHWYGIIITLGILAGVGYAMYRSRHEGLKVEIKDNTMTQWKEIRLPDGNVGWVPAEAVALIADETLPT